MNRDPFQAAMLLPLPVQDMMTGLLATGTLVLAISLGYVRKLSQELPRGINRTSWRLMGLFILLFIAGYIGFFLLKRDSHYDRHELLVPVIFFFGALFVLLVCILAYRTTKELKRVAELEQETITDPLMGIFNRRFLDRRLQEELGRARRHGLDLSLMMLDIDHFKNVNDSRGHQNGDIVLKQLAQLLSDTVRQTDMLARFGGEELVVLLPHPSKVEAAALAERLRVAVEQASFLGSANADGCLDLRITVSIGVSCLFSEEDGPRDILERADKALYEAKAAGRNRVVGCMGAGPLRTVTTQ